MPLVVLDTSVSLPATLSEPGGIARKLMVVLAFGALTYRAEHLHLELEAISNEQGQFGGEIHGTDVLEALCETATNRQAALAELLPYGTPNDWVAVGSAAIFDEYLRILLERGSRIRPDFDEREAPALLARLQSICAIGAPPFDPTRVPAFTSDPNDDPIVYSALLAGADYLVSDDKHIVPVAERPVAIYEHADHTVAAMTFKHFIDDQMSGIEWGEIDGGWLVDAFRRG